MQKCQDLKVAIIHDFLVQYGGAERVLEALCEMFPEAPVYTLLYDKDRMRGKFEGKDIRTSFLQKFPKFLRKRYRWLLPFFMSAPETFDLRDFDLVISSSGAWSKGIVTRLNTIHVAYLHSPARFIWDYNEKYLREEKKGYFLTRIFLNYVRMWDKLAAERPDYLVANSKYTQKRIKKYYGRDSTVIYPPAYAKASAGKPASKKEYFLVVSRLSPYKKVDLVVEAFNKLGLPLLIIGEGRQKEYLERIAKENVKIMGWVADDKLKEYYANARAFIFPTDDDFGVTIVEAMGHGLPVIAYKKGGAIEIIQEGKTGEFFEAQTAEVLADGIRRFMEREDKYSKADMIKRAEEFSKERFEQEFGDYIEKIVGD